MKKCLAVFLVTLLSATVLSGTPLIQKGERIVFIGASITAFGNYPEGYISLVREFLKHNKIQVEIFPRGISAQTSREMSKRAAKDLSDSKATWLVLSCGVNDVGLNRTYDEFTRNYTAILDAAAKAQCKVLLLTLSPHGEELNKERNDRIRKFNDFIRSKAVERKFPLAEVSAEMTKQLEARKDVYVLKVTTDNIHLNGYGNRAFACAVLRAWQFEEAAIKQAVSRWNKRQIITPLINNFFRPTWLISIEDYEVLERAAKREKLSVEQFVKHELLQKVKQLREKENNQ